MMPWVVKTAAASPTKFLKCKVRQRSLHARLPAKVSELKDNAVTSDNVVMIALNSIKDYSRQSKKESIGTYSEAVHTLHNITLTLKQATGQLT